MVLSEIFSTSFLFSIAVVIILVGGLFAYFNHRLSAQNHKISSMMGLVSTMAEEMQYFRSKLSGRVVQEQNSKMRKTRDPFFSGYLEKNIQALMDLQAPMMQGVVSGNPFQQMQEQMQKQTEQFLGSFGLKR